MKKPTKVIVNARTGESKIVPLTKEEIAERKQSVINRRPAKVDQYCSQLCNSSFQWKDNFFAVDTKTKTTIIERMVVATVNPKKKIAWKNVDGDLVNFTQREFIEFVTGITEYHEQLQAVADKLKKRKKIPENFQDPKYWPVLLKEE